MHHRKSTHLQNLFALGFTGLFLFMAACGGQGETSQEAGEGGNLPSGFSGSGIGSPPPFTDGQGDGPQFPQGGVEHPITSGDFNGLAMSLDIHMGTSCHFSGINTCATDCDWNIEPLFIEFLAGGVSAETIHDSCDWRSCKGPEHETPLWVFENIQQYQWTLACETVTDDPAFPDQEVRRCTLEPIKDSVCWDIRTDAIN